MTTLALNIDSSYHDCECCGSYTSKFADFVVNGKTVTCVGHCSHFGGTCWGGDMRSLYLWALALLGYRVRFVNLAGGATADMAPPAMWHQGEHAQIDVEFPPHQVLEVDPGLHQPFPHEYVVAEQQGLPPPVAAPFHPEELRYMGEEQLLAVLQSVATVGIEFTEKSFIPSYGEEDEEVWPTENSEVEPACS